MEENKKRKSENCVNMEYWKKWCDRKATVNEQPSTSIVAVDHISPKNSPSFSESTSVIAPTEITESISINSDFDVMPSSNLTAAKLDIGFYWNEDMDNSFKLRLLKEPWIPCKDYKFPVSTKRNLRFQLNWIDRFPWISYSEFKSGAFCRICVVMGSSLEGKGNHQQVGQLISEPFCNWKKALENFKAHAQTSYHKRNSELADNFIKVMSSKKSSVVELINSERKRQQEENKRKLTSIVKVIITCGKQGLPLRGKFDSGRIKTHLEPDETSYLTSHNEGNFRVILRLVAESGDKILSEHLLHSSNNALYTSPQIQNEIIKICGEAIQEVIIKEVKKARLFAILADESTDIAKIEQMSICLRYVHSDDSKNHNIKEMFLGYVPATDVTGSGLATTILNNIKQYGLEFSHVVGQGYDGAASMSGHLHGAQAYVRKECSHALYVHCSAHSLNLAIADSCSKSEIRNCIGSVQSVGNYFQYSAQRTAALKEKIGQVLTLPANHKKSLLAMCETRWVYKHEAVIRFKEIFPAIIATLNELTNHRNRETSQQAVQLIRTLLDSEFVICLVVLAEIMGYTLPLSKQLQATDTDLTEACLHVDNILKSLSIIRNNADEKFAVISETAKQLIEEHGGSLRMPRIVGRQMHRSNAKTEDATSYYRINLFIPFLEHTMAQLHDRFEKHRTSIMALASLLPQNLDKMSHAVLDYLINMYSSLLPETDKNVIASECQVWKSSFSSTKLYPKSALDCLDLCNKNLYPNIYTLLQILATLPVSTATPERTFSSLRRLKSYLRNTTSENRLNGLALMNIHYDVNVDPKHIVDVFALKKRKILL